MIEKLDITQEELDRQVCNKAVRYGFEQIIKKMNEIIEKVNELEKGDGK